MIFPSTEVSRETSSLHFPRITRPAATETRQPILIQVTGVQLHHASLIAQGRQQGKQYRKPAGDLGSPALNFEADRIGALAELGVYHELQREGYEPDFRLLETFHVPEPDFQLHGLTFDIKACPKAYLAINARKHHEQICDYYLPVIVVSPVLLRVGAPIPHHVVSTWELRPGKNDRGDYFSIHRSQLRPLYSWKELQQR